MPKQIAASSPQNGCSAAPLVMQHLQQQPLAAQQQPAPKQPLRAPTLPPQHAVGSKRSAEAALVSPPPAATLAGAGLALGIPILPHPAALAAREAAAAAAGLPAGADLPGLVVGRPLEPPSEPPAAPAAPFQPASAPGPAQAAAALPLPLFQPSATLADVAAAAARAAEAEGGPVSGNGEQQQQRVEEAGLGGTSFGSAWAGGALDEVVAAAALEEEQQPNKRSRLVWTQELHNRFINALSHLVGAAGGGLPESQAQAARRPPGQGASALPLHAGVVCPDAPSGRQIEQHAPTLTSVRAPALASCRA